MRKKIRINESKVNTDSTGSEIPVACVREKEGRENGEWRLGGPGILISTHKINFTDFVF
jgi:hypothetical protein